MTAQELIANSTKRNEISHASDITEDDIRALRDEAGEAGDEGQVEQCDLALAGNTGCWSNCVDVILAGRG